MRTSINTQMLQVWRPCGESETRMPRQPERRRSRSDWELRKQRAALEREWNEQQRPMMVGARKLKRGR